ncbi:MAG TPA: hypothetical protein VFX37_08740 [Pseudolabrys sp.]|nr:hypothetical protein [Pseudolabrys sp.]
MTTLTSFIANNTSRAAANLDVMGHRFNGPHIGEGRSIGSADRYFGTTINHVTVGDAQGADDARGTYDWWPLILDGQKIGELRDDANGLTIHVMTKKSHPNRGKVARKIAKGRM